MLTISVRGRGIKMIKGIDNFQVNNYNAFKVNNNPVSDESLKNRKSEEVKQEQAASKSLDLRLDDIRPRKNAAIEDISLSLNEPSGFEMKGRDSDIESLDMAKAVSDMQKDQALMQYQYFVGDPGILSNDDGIVIPK